MKESKIIEMLRELGFNRIEAQIYIFLLPHSPMTAYKIAQKIGKPAANVYKAVECLAHKGALVIEDGPNRTCRAMPTDIFLRRAEQDFYDTGYLEQAGPLAELVLIELREGRSQLFNWATRYQDLALQGGISMRASVDHFLQTENS